jgi:hypothetical protein
MPAAEFQSLCKSGFVHFFVEEKDVKCDRRRFGDEVGGTVCIRVTHESIRFVVKGDTHVVTAELRGGEANAVILLGQCPFVPSRNISCLQLNCLQNQDNSEQVLIRTENNDAPLELNFSLKYIRLFVKATPLAKTVKLSMAQDFPLTMEYRLYDDAEGNLKTFCFFSH